MALSNSFVAAARLLAREYRDRIFQEQSSFAVQMSAANTVMTSAFSVGMVRIARQETLDFIRKAANECEELQDLGDGADYEEAVSTIVATARELLNLGSNRTHETFAPMADMARMRVIKELQEEVRDRISVAQDKRRAKQKKTVLSWTLLFLQSNPINEDFLATNREHREVRQAIREADYRDQIDLVIESAVRIRDVFRAINEHRPRVVHFSGHGDQRCLALLDEHDQTRPIDGQVLADLLEANDDDVQVVVLNSCDSHSQAERLLAAVPYVVGTNGPLDDEAAIIFSRTFYSALAHGRSVAASFRQGIVALKAEVSLASVPYKLHSQPGKDADAAILVATSAVYSDSIGWETLSKREQDLMKAVADTGELHILESDQTGRWVREGKTDFFDDSDGAVATDSIEALQSLTLKRLIRHESGTCYVLTGAGWNLKRECTD